MSDKSASKINWKQVVFLYILFQFFLLGMGSWLGWTWVIFQVPPDATMVTFRFNQHGEYYFELIMFPVIFIFQIIFGLYLLITYIRRMFSK